jgi:hypothetical protein
MTKADVAGKLIRSFTVLDHPTVVVVYLQHPNENGLLLTFSPGIWNELEILEIRGEIADTSNIIFL